MKDIIEFRKLIHSLEDEERLKALDGIVKDAMKVLVLKEEIRKLSENLYESDLRMSYMFDMVEHENDLPFLQAAAQFTDGKLNYINSKKVEEVNSEELDEAVSEDEPKDIAEEG